MRDSEEGKRQGSIVVREDKDFHFVGKKLRHYISDTTLIMILSSNENLTIVTSIDWKVIPTLLLYHYHSHTLGRYYDEVIMY